MNLKYEQQKITQGYSTIIGCDEVGRGCLAGPVVAAAVVFDPAVETQKWFHSVNDSKVLSPKKREELSSLIKEQSLAWAIKEVDQQTIDKINIHQASLLAMRKATEDVVQARGLPEKHEKQAKGLHYENDCLVLIDGKFLIPKFDMKQEAIVDGDAKIFSIAAASIIAKVYRDSLMEKLDGDYPGYDFSKHKGYATLHHRNAIKKLGLSPLHRISFCSNYI